MATQQVYQPPEQIEALAARLRNSYRSLDGVVVVSPKLLSEAATALEAHAEAARHVPGGHLLVRRDCMFDPSSLYAGQIVVFV